MYYGLIVATLPTGEAYGWRKAYAGENQYLPNCYCWRKPYAGEKPTAGKKANCWRTLPISCI